MQRLLKGNQTSVLLLLAVTITIFLLFQLALALTVDLPEYDEAIYLNVARSIRQTGIAERSMGEGVLYADHTPLYQYFLGLSTLVLGENLLTLRLLTSIFAVGCILLCFAIGAELQDRLTGLAAALTLALNPFFTYYSFFLRAEIPMVFFLLLGLHFLVKWESKGTNNFLAWAGISMAVAVLLRENAIIFWFAALLYVVTRGSSWKKRLSNAIWVGLPVIVALVLWIGWIAVLSPPHLQGTLSRWLNSATGSTEVIIHDARLGIPFQVWLITIGSQLLGWETVLFFMVALLMMVFFRPRKLPPVTALLILYIGFNLAYSLLVALREPRHIIGIIPMMAILINLLIDWPQVTGWLRRKVRRPVLLTMGIILLIVAAWSISPLQLPRSGNWRNPEAWWTQFYQTRMFDNDRYYSVLRDAGQYLSETTPSGETIVIVHEGTVLGYYADRPYDFLYTRTYDSVMDTLMEANYLVYDNPSFFYLSEEEIEKTDSYIDSNFEIEKMIQDDYRSIKIYRRVVE